MSFSRWTRPWGCRVLMILVVDTTYRLGLLTSEERLAVSGSGLFCGWARFVEALVSRAMASLLRPPPGCSPAGWSDVVGAGCDMLDIGIMIFTRHEWGTGERLSLQKRIWRRESSFWCYGHEAGV